MQDTQRCGARVAAMRQVLTKAVRDAFREHGIPQGWIAAETVTAVSAHEAPGLHLRLTVQEWHPTLMDHAFSLQRDIASRMSQLDPLAATWLAGITWKFKLADESVCPVLPAPGHWQALASRSADAAERRGSVASSARQAMEQQMRRNDAAFGGCHDDFTPTTPMRLPEAAR